MQNPSQEDKKKEPLLDKKLLGKDKKLKAQIKSAVFLKKKSEKHLKIQRFLENGSGGWYFIWNYNIYSFFINFRFLQPEENEQTLKFRQNDLKPLLPIQNLQNVGHFLDFIIKSLKTNRFSIWNWISDHIILTIHEMEKCWESLGIKDIVPFSTGNPKV